MKMDAIRSFVESNVTRLQSLCGGDVLTVSMSEGKGRYTITVDNAKGTICLKNFWNDDTQADFDRSIKDIESDISESLQLGGKMPKPKHKPLFTTEEIYCAIAKENS